MDRMIVRQELHKLADPRTASFLQKYFKTGPGEYGEGDRFLGIRVPQVRRIARRARTVPTDDLVDLLRSVWHEERLLAVLVLVDRYGRGDQNERSAIYELYLNHTRYINNWDLVDVSAGPIVGAHVDPARPRPLERLARSESVWERRVAIMATFYWTKQGRLEPALHIAGLLRDDPHDLIHKAVGWMLREVGKQDREAEERFLHTHYLCMPRTMLRYALEHFPESRRQAYLLGRV